jgi:hypothetical protein
MTHKDSGWRPNLGGQQYKGHEIWDHVGGPHEFNEAEVDGDVDLEDVLGGIDEIVEEDDD